MGKPDDFDLIDEREVEKESRSLLWLAVAIAVIGFALAVGVALLTLSSRLKGAPAAEIGVTETATTAPAELPAQPTAVLTVSATATSTPPATPTSTPTSSPTPACAHEVDAAFGQAAIGNALGCPQTAPGQTVWAAWEPFERGAMLWRSDTDLAYIFANNGLWATVNERWSGEDQPSRGAPPPGLFAPERGFGYVWAASGAIFDRLGWATDVEKGFCARVQEFEHGFVLQSEAISSCTADNLYNHATSADWRPIRINAHNNGTWR